MKQLPPVKKNDDVLLDILSVSSESQGIAKKDGFTFFVPGTLAGEHVKAHVIKVNANYAIAKPVEFESMSCDRVRPVCSAYPQCGGCTLQHLDYSAQLKLKSQIVQDAFERIGGFSHVSVPETLGMQDPWNYRNKGSFPLGTENGRVVFGFFSPRSHRLIPLNDCFIQNKQILTVLRSVCDWATENGIPTYDENTKKGILRHVVVRISSKEELMATVVTTGPLPKKEALIEYLPQVTSLYHNVNKADTNVIFGQTFHLIHGIPALRHELLETVFSVGPESFLQVNTLQTEILYRTVLEFLHPMPTETILDAYCGIGTISLQIAKSAKKVIGLEIVSQAIENAKQNAFENGFTNVDFICGPVEKTISMLAEDFDAIVVDPPRKGCDESVLHSIGQSAVPRIIYVSCNPSTLARDCCILSKYGFTLTRIQPVDLFPHTAHVETVVLLSRND